ncbi:MAG: FAD-dependent monooxygenase [Gammaproteobacteria bacterium]
MQTYDVVISGGGMVGATLGAALAQQSGGALRILIVEKEPPSVAPPSTFDVRSIVLSRSTVRFLYQNGWWSACRPMATPIERVMVRSGRQFGAVDFSASEAHVPALGYVMGARDLGDRLWAAVAAQPSLTVWSGAQISTTQPIRRGWRVTVQHAGSTEVLDTRLLVVAEGACSTCLTQLGIHTTVHRYQKSALVCGLEAVSLAPRVATEQFVGQLGSVAVLPRGAGRAGVVLATTPEQAAQWLNAPAACFMKELSLLLGETVSRLGLCTARAIYPLCMTYAQETIRAGLVVVGNAAQTVHPIAGQGFNLAVRDVAALCAHMNQVLASGGACAEANNGALLALDRLQSYETQRKTDRLRIRQFCHTLLKLFSQSRADVAIGRQLGMLLFDVVPSVKTALAHSVLAPRTGPVSPLCSLSPSCENGALG